MSAESYNRVRIVFNAEHKPYLYGAVHIIDGSLENQWWEKPFVISKRRPGGGEVVYGTVKRTLEKISDQMDRLKRFQSETKAKLDAGGITPLIRDHAILPACETTDRILDEQENLIEDVLLTVSVNIRILSEIFPQKLKNSMVKVYDYEDGCAGRIELSEIANLLLHNRYILVRDQYVVDLFSDHKFMAQKSQMGLKINFLEYFREVRNLVNGMTVKDLITMLWGATKNLSASSDIRDIIFLTQNLYTLGGFVIGTDTPISGPWETIMNRVAMEYVEKAYPKNSIPDGGIEFVAMFSEPRFVLEPDLNQKQIRVAMRVNDNHQTLVMEYEAFFREVLKASGNRKLYVCNDRKAVTL